MDPTADILVDALAREGSGRASRSAETLGCALGDARRRLRPAEADAVRVNLIHLGLEVHRRRDLDLLTEQTFRAFGIFLVEFMHGLSRSPQAIMRGWDIEGSARLASLLDQRRGFILAGAHTGNWEHLSALARYAGRQLIIPTDTQFHPLLTPPVRAWKARRGIDSRPPNASPRGLLRALEQGALVGIPLDGGSFRSEARVVLGARPVGLAAGATRLALQSGCPVLPVFARRTAFMRQEVRILPALWPGDFAGDRATRRQAFAQALADRLGAHLRRAAGQWCIFRRLAWYD
jgi:KDO2-lipid IV(A) lauroyltransferase